MKRDEGRHQRHARLAAQRDRLDEVGARVSLVEQPQHAVVDRLDRARHERAAGRGQPRHEIAVLQQVLDLDRDVVADARDAPRAAPTTIRIACVGPLKKSGSPKVMCRAPAATCAADVGEHDVGLHDAELPLVDRHDRTVPAQVPAAAAGFGVADQPALAVRHLQRGVVRERRQAACDRGRGSESAAATDVQTETAETAEAADEMLGSAMLCGSAVPSDSRLGPRRQILFELAAEDLVDAERRAATPR